MSDIKLSMPPMAGDQDSWRLYHNPPPLFTATAQAWWKRLIYRALMRVSAQSEKVWHWTYYKARPFGPITKVETVEPRLYGFVGQDGIFHKKVDGGHDVC